MTDETEIGSDDTDDDDVVPTTETDDLENDDLAADDTDEGADLPQPDENPEDDGDAGQPAVPGQGEGGDE